MSDKFILHLQHYINNFENTYKQKFTTNTHTNTARPSKYLYIQVYIIQDFTTPLILLKITF